MDFPFPSLDLSSVQTKPNTVGQRRFLLQYVGPGEFNLQIDNSSLEVFNACAKSAEYKLVHAREAPPKAALTYGSAVHEGLEVYYRDKTLGIKDESTMRQDMFAAAQVPFEKQPVSLDEWRTADRAIDTLQRYMKHYEHDEIEVQVQDNVPLVELPFSLPLGVVEYEPHLLDYKFCEIVDPTTYPDELANNPVEITKVNIYWTGKIDLAILLDGKDDWISDHKTTSLLGPTYWTDFEISNQTVGYCWAGQKIFNRPFRGLLLNVIYSRPPLKSGLKKTEFHRKRYYYRQDQIDEWESNTLTLCSDFISNLMRGEFPFMYRWCVGKYGVCPYHDVCKAPAAQREMILNTDLYTDVTWSPLNKD